jgi:hypothetical protein
LVFRANFENTPVEIKEIEGKSVRDVWCKKKIKNEQKMKVNEKIQLLKFCGKNEIQT